MPRKKTSDKAYSIRVVREERRSKGLCPVCGQPNDRHPKYNCSACLEKHNQRTTKWRMQQLIDKTCPQCGNPLDRDGWCCQSCYEKLKGSMSDLRSIRKAQHKCVWCGEDSGEESICPVCKDKRKNRKDGGAA